MVRKNLRHYEMRIGNFYRFNYVSSTPKKEYADPIRIDMTSDVKLALIASVQGDAARRETVFAALLAETDKPSGLSDMQIRLDDMEAKRQAEKIAKGLKKAPIPAEQKELQAAIDTEWQRLIGSKRTGKTMQTAEQPFFRQYKADKIELSENGKYYACLVSKTISKKGEIIFTFLKTSPVTWSKSEFDSLDDNQKKKLVAA